MVVDAGSSNKSGRVNKKRSRASNRKAQKVSLRIKIEDHKEFPPLNGPVSAESPGNVDYLSKEKPVEFGGTTYYVPQGLDAMAAPFQSVLNRLDKNSVAGQKLATSYDTTDEDGQSNRPGGVYFVNPSLLTNECPLFIYYGLRQAVWNRFVLSQEKLSEPVKEGMIFDTYQLHDQLEPRPGLICGRESTIYLGSQIKTGKCVAVRKVDAINPRNGRLTAIASKWRNLHHPYVVQLLSITTSRRENQSSVLFEYDYHPNARTLQQFCVDPQGYAITEYVIWSFTTQLVSALRAIHRDHLAVRTLCPQRVLVTGVDNCTVRINSVAISDVIEVADLPHLEVLQYCADVYEAPAEYRQQDIVQLGEVVQFMVGCLEQQGLKPSGELEYFVKSLTTGKFQIMDDAIEALGPRVFNQLDEIQAHKNVLEGELFKEIDNGRLFRLMTMVLQAVWECQSAEVDDLDEASLLIRLFGDFLFRNESLYHIVSALNKLDAGARTNIHLSTSSPLPHSYRSDGTRFGSCGQHCYVVTYEELRAIFHQRYMQNSATPASPAQCDACQFLQSGNPTVDPFRSYYDWLAFSRATAVDFVDIGNPSSAALMKARQLHQLPQSYGLPQTPKPYHV
ncbi:PAB-dependent poly(A)-specific ribonuclease subunit pan3-like [Tropilaelaps mercedesae]|uniref:PAB-dependent poly(A)-specific ribonuclease subunit pan3-like n=1 Tax=Tropilaelaps mercedesae TaxID=418985 RepID=A0A1V9XT21_9ACAR|nr:PAB-dependent poly(A)-specific ribonuclease subunit pan3-like [Tropilaelaps mercedesae]